MQAQISNLYTDFFCTGAGKFDFDLGIDERSMCKPLFGSFGPSYFYNVDLSGAYVREEHVGHCIAVQCSLPAGSPGGTWLPALPHLPLPDTLCSCWG